MAVHHIDVTGTPVQVPTGFAAPGSPVWIEIRPDLRRGAVIAGDILAALGKRRDVAGRGRNENEDVALALAWMHSYAISALVATEAQRLSPLLLRQIAGLAAAAGIPLWLLHRTPRSDVFLKGLARRNAHPMRLSDVPTAQPRLDPAGSRPTLGVQLPAAPFHRFLSTCRAALSASDFTKVRDQHAQSSLDFADTLDRDGAELDQIAHAVERILHAAPQDDVLVTDLRALQLAAWHHDVYLKSNIDQLLASPERQLTDPISVDQALVAYRQPHRPISVTLTLHQVGVTDIRALRIRDASPDGGVVTRGGRRIDFPEHAARALAAQLQLCATHLADPSDPLLTVTDRAISQALNDANLDLNIRVHGRKAERHLHPGRWLRSLGLTLHDLP